MSKEPKSSKQPKDTASSSFSKKLLSGALTGNQERKREEIKSALMRLSDDFASLYDAASRKSPRDEDLLLNEFKQVSGIRDTKMTAEKDLMKYINAMCNDAIDNKRFPYEMAQSLVRAFVEQEARIGMAERKASVGKIDPRTGAIDPRMAGRYSGLGTFDEWGPAPPQPPVGSKELAEAKSVIDKITEILERIKKEPLLMHRITRIYIDKKNKDKKYTFFKIGDKEVRIEAPPELKVGDEVLLHPKTMGIVENLGEPPLETSRFSPANPPNVAWDDIGGLDGAKADMIEAIEMPHKHKELFEFYKKRPIKGILLSGPPGCGKTMLGKAAATSLAKLYGKESINTGFMYVKGPEILDKYVGETESTIRDMFYDANRHKEEHGYPAIIFLDEADAILASRGSFSVGIGNTIVPMFLTEMDGLEANSAIVIIATNRPDILDPAIVRDGRVDRKITIPRPNQQTGKSILKMNLAKVPLAAGLDIDSLAEEIVTNFYSPQRMVKKDVKLSDVVNGAMLANCVDMAVSLAVKREINTGTRDGLQIDDCLMAIDRIQEQSHSVQHEIEITMNIKEKGGG